MEFLESRADIKTQYDSLMKNLKLADSLKGKEVEFLFVKKELEEKLTHLFDFKIRPMPINVTRQFQFVQGPVELGTIRDPYESDDEEEDETEADKIVAVETAEKSVGTEETMSLTRQTQTMLSQKDFKFSMFPGPKFPVAKETQTVTVTTDDASTQLPNEVQQKLHAADNQGIAILPNGDLVLIDAEDNRLAILDKRGRFRYTFDAEQLSIPDELHLGNLRKYEMDKDKLIRIYTPYGHLLTCSDDEVITCLPLGTKVEKHELFRQ